MPNFIKIGQSFFFKMAAAALLDCRIHKILLADSDWRAQTHYYTKYCQNRLFHCTDIAIFRFFQDGRRRHHGCLKSQNFIGYWGPEGGVASAYRSLHCLISVNSTS